MLAGTLAVRVYTGIERETKDMDIFVKPGDYPKILNLFAEAGYKTEVVDERWLAKVHDGKQYFDVIWNLQNAQTHVTDDWFTHAEQGEILGMKVHVLPPAELIFAKVFVQDRLKYDGSDVAHIILSKHKHTDWKKLLSYMDQYWEVLLGHVLNFRFIYPSEREEIPKWLLDELIERLQNQINTPTPKNKICRGRLFSLKDYYIDVSKLGFGDVIGGDVHESRIIQD
jgi:hypothetical protein